MNKLEKLEQEAFEDSVKVHDYYLGEESLKGIYIDGNIAINTSVNNTAEKACILAEELGHHHTSVGNIINMENVSNQKQERQARIWGYNKLIGLNGIINAFEAGCQSSHEAAEYLDVTDEFFSEAIECYRNKYGVYKEFKDYIIYFIPHLSVLKMI